LLAKADTGTPVTCVGAGWRASAGQAVSA